MHLLMRIAACAVAAAGISAFIGAHLIWNQTDSIPRGLYWAELGPVRTLRRNDLVAFPVPPAIRDLVLSRGYLTAGAVLVKPVAALPGDAVCSERGLLEIAGRIFGPVADRDTIGRSLPRFVVCGRLPPGEVYVASRHPRSLDSRAFGPVALRSITGRVRPLWTL